MKRTLRTPDELFRIFDDAPHLGALYYTLAGLDGITVRPDGTGDSLFKVYLRNRTGQYEAFLWVSRTLHKSYVQWLHQAENADRCRELWGPVVKKDSNPDGSELKPDVDPERIIRLVRQYAEIAAY